MGLLQGLESLIGSGDIQRLAGGNGDFHSPGSSDQQRIQAMVGQMDPQHTQQVFSQAARQNDPGEYAQHVAPQGGSSPFSNLGGGSLRTIANLLVQHLGGSGGAGGGIGSLLNKIPGLQTTDPNQMDANQVAAMSQYAQQNHPDAFGKVAAQIGHQQPDLLHSFLGKAGLAVGAAALASHFIKMDQH